MFFFDMITIHNHQNIQILWAHGPKLEKVFVSKTPLRKTELYRKIR